MRTILILLLSALSLCATTITDTIKTPFGTPWVGKVAIDCPSGVTASGETIRRWKTTVTVTAGAFSVSIDPGDAGSPLGRTCKADYYSSNGTHWQETWAVTTSATALKISDVQVVGSEPSTTTPLAGDLTGYYPNPTVKGLRGRTVASTAPTNGQALIWSTSASAWQPGTVAAGAGSGDMLAANNLSDLADAATARTNLGLGDSATKNTGSAAGTVSAGDHTHAGLTGTTSTAWQIDSGNSGPKLKNESGALAVRNAADDDYLDLTVKSLTTTGTGTTEFTNQADPSTTPASGKTEFRVDSASKVAVFTDDAGAESTTTKAITCDSGQHISAKNADGTYTCSADSGGAAVTKVTMTRDLPFGGFNSGGTGYPAGGVRIPAANSPTLTVQETAPFGIPTLQFAKGTTDPTIIVNTVIPANWDGTAMGLTMRRFSGSGTPGNELWDARGACSGDGDNLSNPTFPVGWTTVTDSVTAGSELKTVDFGDFSRAAGCAAGEILHIEVRRHTSDGGDAFTGSAYVPGLVLTYKVTLE